MYPASRTHPDQTAQASLPYTLAPVPLPCPVTVAATGPQAAALRAHGLLVRSAGFDCALHTAGTCAAAITISGCPLMYGHHLTTSDALVYLEALHEGTVATGARPPAVYRRLQSKVRRWGGCVGP